MAFEHLKNMDYDALTSYIKSHSGGGHVTSLRDPESQQSVIIIKYWDRICLKMERSDGEVTEYNVMKNPKSTRVNQMVPDTVDIATDMRGLGTFAKDEPFL